MRVSFAHALGLAAVLPFASCRSAAQHPLSSSSSLSLPPSPLPYTVSSLTRSLEVGGTITREQLTVVLKPNPAAASAGTEWWYPIEDARLQSLAWLEATQGKKKAAGPGDKLVVAKGGFDATT